MKNSLKEPQVLALQFSDIMKRNTQTTNCLFKSLLLCYPALTAALASYFQKGGKKQSYKIIFSGKPSYHSSKSKIHIRLINAVSANKTNQAPKGFFILFNVSLEALASAIRDPDGYSAQMRRLSTQKISRKQNKPKKKKKKSPR